MWDVSHQVYVHKILTGRRDRFSTIRKGGGLSGFAMRSESEYDPFGAGHASTSVSSALGMATARDLAGGDETVVAVIGDGALTGGLAYEALNNAGSMKSNFIVILNDNEMSIAPNVGSMASYLSVLRTKPLANFARRTGKAVLDRIPLGGAAKKAIEATEIGAMHFIAPAEKTAVIFEELGFRYMGPIDGHNYDAVVDVLKTAKEFHGPVLVHVRTVKGKGFEPAERDARTFHGVGANSYEPNDGSKKSNPGAPPKFQDVFADALISLAEKDPRIVGITAAMPDGTGLAKFGKRFPDRYFDVGIAEAHAVCFAAGMATNGLRPVCAIYSTFLQRAYDQIVHDVVVQNLPVVFCMDRVRFRRRRRPDAHGPVRHRLFAHAAQHHADGTAQRRRDAPDARARARAQRAGRHSLPARFDQRQASRRTRADGSRQSRSAAARSRHRDPRLRQHGRSRARRLRCAAAQSKARRRRPNCRPSSTRASANRSTKRCSSNSRATIRTSSRWKSIRSPAGSVRPCWSS